MNKIIELSNNEVKMVSGAGLKGLGIGAGFGVISGGTIYKVAKHGYGSVFGIAAMIVSTVLGYCTDEYLSLYKKYKDVSSTQGKN